MFGEQFGGTIDFRGVHDFDTFCRDYRPRSADRNIRKQFSLEFECREDGKIFIRSKKHCGANIPWGPWAQILPFPGREEVELHPPATCPALAAAKPWTDFEEVLAPLLLKFYERETRHPVTIPERDLEEMRAILNNGFDDVQAPDWIDWDTPVAGDSDTPGEEEESSEPEPSSDDNEWVPFLAPKRRRVEPESSGTLACLCVRAIM